MYLYGLLQGVSGGITAVSLQGFGIGACITSVRFWCLLSYHYTWAIRE